MAASSEIAAIALVLKRLVKAKGLTYAQLADTLGISEGSVKRYLNGHRVTMEVMERILGVIGIGLSEFYEIAARETVSRPSRLTHEQELGLCEQPSLILVLVLLLQRWSPSEIEAELGLSYAALTAMLLKLETLGIILLHPGNRVKMRIGPSVSTERDGPIRRGFDTSTKKYFIEMDFYAEDSIWDVQFVKLSRSSVLKMTDLLKALGNEIRMLGDNDRKSEAQDAQWYAILSAGRPLDLQAYLTDLLRLQAEGTFG